MSEFDFSLEDLVTFLNGKWSGDHAIFNRVCLDSRLVQPGDCFIALRGERVNGHDCIAQAKAKGAVAVIGSETMPKLLPSLQVPSVEQALILLAKKRRAAIKVPVIAITGSCGKTTTKMLLVSILKQTASVHYAVKSFNNSIGLPLTLLQTQPHHAYVVLEIGCNQPGEIAALTQIAQPTVSILTNAAPAHLAGLGSLEGVAQEKGNIITNTRVDGTVILNQDDAFYSYWQKLVDLRHSVTIGLTESADWRGEILGYDEQQHPQVQMTTPFGVASFTLPLVGNHNVLNALHAAAAAQAVGYSLATIKQGLATSYTETQRMEVHALSPGITLIDDSYNANPASMKAAINLLSQYKNKTIMIIGDMGELGEKTQDYHEELGKQARSAGITALYALGEWSQYAITAFGEGGIFFTTPEALLSQIKEEIQQQNTVILVKGSRSMHLERIVQPLLEMFK